MTPRGHQTELDWSSTVGNDSKAEVVEFPAGRNIGRCKLAAATEGRQHFPVCVNGRRGVEWTTR